MSGKSKEQTIDFDSNIKYILKKYEEQNVKKALDMIKKFIKTQELSSDNDFKKKFISIFQEELQISEKELLSLITDIVTTFDIRTTPSSLKDVTMDFLYLSLNNLEEKAIIGALAGTFIRTLHKGMTHEGYLVYKKEQDKIFEEVLDKNPGKYTHDEEGFLDEFARVQKLRKSGKSSGKSGEKPPVAPSISVIDKEKMRVARLKRFDKTTEKTSEEHYDSTYNIKFNNKKFSIPYNSSNDDTRKLKNIVKKLIKLLIKERLNIENETSVEILYQKHSNYITFIQGGKKFKLSENKDMIVDVSKPAMIMLMGTFANKLTRKKLKKDKRKTNTRISKRQKPKKRSKL